MPHMAHTLDTSKQSSILFPKAKKRMPKKRIKKSEKNGKKTTVQHIFVLIFYDFMSLLYNWQQIFTFVLQFEKVIFSDKGYF